MSIKDSQTEQNLKDAFAGDTFTPRHPSRECGVTDLAPCNGVRAFFGSDVVASMRKSFVPSNNFMGAVKRMRFSADVDDREDWAAWSFE